MVSHRKRSGSITTAAALVVAGALPLFAQSEPAHAAFEVASVRPHQGSGLRSGPLYTVSSPLIRMEGYTVFALILDAWNLRDFQIAVAPAVPKEEIYNTMYDVIARAPGDGVPDTDGVRAMLRSLLADRFRLGVHRETKEMPVYALQAGKNGVKLKASPPGGQCSLHVELASDGRNDEEIFSSCPIERLADRIEGKVGSSRPVLDQTGLKGLYDMRLVALPEYRTRGQSDAADIDAITAVGELGLKLVAQKAPVEIIVVDRLEKPTEN
jgi:uncharacterized protein (TIGR03435 family)